MGRKIFISYKYADSDVKHLKGAWYENNTVRTYVDELEDYLKNSSEHIYKGESDGEDLSKLSESTIWNKLKERIYDSSLTLVVISKGMREQFRVDRDQWIPWEISYSLKEISRKNSSGSAVTSRTNAMMAVVIPDLNGNYDYYTYNKSCCDSGCRIFLTNKLFDILGQNMFNKKDKNSKDCSDGSTVHYGEHSYIISVKWDDFIKNVDHYIERAYENQSNISQYEIKKDV